MDRLDDRGRAVLALSLIVVVLLICQAVFSTVIMGSQLRMRADNNRFFIRKVFPTRGIIVDRTGVPLVENIAMYRKIDDDPTAIHPRSTPIDEGTAFSLFLHDPSRLIMTQERSYPFGPLLAHLVGYTGFISSSENTQMISSEEKVGKTGAERLFDSTLRGTMGAQEYERNARGKLVRLSHTKEPIAGRDVALSVSARVSRVAAQLLKDRKGAVVVSDVNTGQVIALVSAPSFSPHDIGASLNDPNTPLLNRALRAYPPGSVFKMITALSALKKGAITKDKLITDEGEIKVGQARFRNWYFTSYGRTEGDINVVKALARSNDVFFYKIAQEVGPDDIASMAKTFHLGERTGIGLSGEQVGTIPDPAWKEKVIGEKWYLGDTYHVGIGQGDVLTTPLQINAMTAAIGARGVWCKPTVLLDAVPACGDVGISQSDLETVTEGMVQACSTGGTAFPFFAYNQTAPEGKKVACKTGTAEHGGVDENGRRKTHAWLTLFFPSVDPKVAITVLLESTSTSQFLEGSADAAPIAKQVWDEWVRENQ